MIYISIPVHEKIEIIIDQSKNFYKFFPEAMIVLHLSKGATFSLDNLKSELSKENVNNVLVNPKQVETSWGGILNAHLENIRYILTLDNAEKVIFHSSNDMLVKKGVFDYVKNRKNIFNQRPISEDSFWWVGRRALKDLPMMNFFDNHLLGSQIEGSMYEISLLEELVKEVDENSNLLKRNRPYPKEEIIFSSFANKKNIENNGLPYIFSEVHRFDHTFFKYINKYLALFDRNGITYKALKYIINLLVLRFLKYQINIRDINAIVDSNAEYFKGYTELIDGKNIKWSVFDINNIFGVKRVSRDLQNTIRVSINNINGDL